MTYVEKKYVRSYPNKIKKRFKKKEGECKIEAAVVAVYDLEEMKRVGKKLNNDPVDLDA